MIVIKNLFLFVAIFYLPLYAGHLQNNDTLSKQELDHFVDQYANHMHHSNADEKTMIHFTIQHPFFHNFIKAKKHLIKDPEHQQYDAEKLKNFMRAWVVLQQLRTACTIHTISTNKNMVFLSDHPETFHKIESIVQKDHVLPFALINLEKTSVVKQGEWELMKPNDQYDTLVTSPLSPCCAVVAFNEETNTLGLYHTDYSVSHHNLMGFLKAMAPHSQQSLLLKVVTFNNPTHDDKPEQQYPSVLSRGMIKTVLADTLTTMLQQHHPHHRYLSFDQQVPSHPDDAASKFIFAPEVIAKSTDHQALKPYEHYLTHFTTMIQHCYMLEEKLFHNVGTMQALAITKSTDATSFGITKNRDIFSTNYPLSLRAFRPTDLKNLIHLPYAMRTHAVVLPKEHSIYQVYASKQQHALYNIGQQLMRWFKM